VLGVDERRVAEQAAKSAGARAVRGEHGGKQLFVVRLQLGVDVTAVVGRGELERAFDEGRHRAFELERSTRGGRAAAVVFGIGSLQQPGGGPPVGAGGRLHDGERVGGVVVSQAELLVKVGVAAGLALHGAQRHA
jgi:hypothetical protein